MQHTIAKYTNAAYNINIICSNATWKGSSLDIIYNSGATRKKLLNVRRIYYT